MLEFGHDYRQDLQMIYRVWSYLQVCPYHRTHLAGTSLRALATYKQGQNDPDRSKIREYFYYIDHNGMVGYYREYLQFLIF